MLQSKPTEEGACGSCPGKRDSKCGCVECSNMSIECKNQNTKGKFRACPSLSLFRENSQWSDDSKRGIVRRGANRSSLPEGKTCSQQEADGFVVLGA